MLVDERSDNKFSLLNNVRGLVFFNKIPACHDDPSTIVKSVSALEKVQNNELWKSIKSTHSHVNDSFYFGPSSTRKLAVVIMIALRKLFEILFGVL